MAGTLPALYTNPATDISAPASYTGEFAKTADYSVKSSDNGKLLTNAGANSAVNFTLPSITNAGYYYGFLVVAGFQVTVTSAEGNNILWFNNAGASSLSFNTANGLIGGWLDLMTNVAGTKWYVTNRSASPNASGGNVVTVS